jgi:hypothetical protein
LLIENVKTPSSNESPHAQHNSIFFLEDESPFFAKARFESNISNAVRRRITETVEATKSLILINHVV